MLSCDEACFVLPDGFLCFSALLELCSVIGAWRVNWSLVTRKSWEPPALFRITSHQTQVCPLPKENHHQSAIIIAHNKRVRRRARYRHKAQKSLRLAGVSMYGSMEESPPAAAPALAPAEIKAVRKLLSTTSSTNGGSDVTGQPGLLHEPQDSWDGKDERRRTAF